MTEPEDVKRQDPDYMKQIRDRYESEKAKAQDSALHAKWKALTSAQRMYIAGIAVFLVIAFTMAIVAYKNEPVARPNPERGA